MADIKNGLPDYIACIGLRFEEAVGDGRRRPGPHACGRANTQDLEQRLVEQQRANGWRSR